MEYRGSCDVHAGFNLQRSFSNDSITLYAGLTTLAVASPALAASSAEFARHHIDAVAAGTMSARSNRNLRPSRG